MGPPLPLAGYISIPESSALLANTLLTGRRIEAGQSLHIIFFSLLASFTLLFCIHLLRPFTLLLAGLGSGILCIFIFGAAFIIGAYWIDPIIPMAGCLGGTLFLFISGFCVNYGKKLRFRYTLAPFVNNTMLRKLRKPDCLIHSETLCANAAVIAVKKSGLSGLEDREKPLEAAIAAAKFKEDFSRIFKQAGAVILGFEGDVMLACFGSPLEQITNGKPGEQEMNPSLRAIRFVRELLGKNTFLPECRFGIEAGECAFSWPETGTYTANGRPVVRARIFALLAKRYKVNAVIGEPVKNAAGLQARKLSALGSGGTDNPENFYELPVEAHVIPM
jgi:class 3 adenylate cyclase